MGIILVAIIGAMVMLFHRVAGGRAV
jgi:hypothetical protein